MIVMVRFDSNIISLGRTDPVERDPIEMFLYDWEGGIVTFRKSVRPEKRMWS